MPTPAFKVLLNAIRLGQPPEPVSGVRALAEALDRQQAEIADLKQRVSLLTSRLQFSEAKSARLEAALASRGHQVSPTPVPFSVGQLDDPPPPSLPPLVQSGQQRDASPEDLARSGAHQSRVASQPAFVVPTLIPGRRQSQDGIPSLVPLDEPSVDDSSGTLVVPRADIDAVVQRIVSSQDAPFPLAQPGTVKRTPTGDSSVPFKPHDQDAPSSARVLEALPLQDDTYAQTNEHPMVHDETTGDDLQGFSKRK